ncbi:hypothetical protein [Vibrio genomosp. F10]|uniref:Uncharacterized protein n=1 Tax=Vibrio genomosp. F10 str. ZF-129 TaxID=1187848 RepID=A0A1E5BB87_9VIBR|nr:hypothetical protein [Vibrio genomosp. F10]OEE31383.1 hypothetical protein A1QO_13770 [Vibrio genomosp. F10 str. ZF-129]OEE95117.1 hypothetical protein A1QM_05520 [Vibrio genomosp. F10 str. 9ZC157]OEF10661.1 hypothetical protein A1QI_00250 [Vibrio genomosp. F10 str. 9ZB36]
MDKPKTYIAALLIATFILLLVTYFLPDDSDSIQIQGTITDQSMIQSLDGQRHYLIVDVPDAGVFRVSIGGSVQCKLGTSVLLKANTSKLSTATHFQFISC